MMASMCPCAPAVAVLALLQTASGRAPQVRPPRQETARPATPPAPPTPAPRPPAPPGLSWEDALSIEQTIARVERRLRTGRPASGEPIVVTERQVNSYVTLSLGPRMPPGISGLQVQLQQDRLGLRAMLDLDRLKQKMPQGAALGMLAFLSGTVPVELLGRVSSADGVGRVEIESASLAGISLPTSLVAQIVSLTTRTASQPRGFDVAAPFRLPWSMREVRFEAGRAVVDFLR